MENTGRPILGPIPRWLWLEHRYEHLMQYVERCRLADQEPLAIHMRELREIHRELNGRHKG